MLGPQERLWSSFGERQDVAEISSCYWGSEGLGIKIASCSEFM